MHSVTDVERLLLTLRFEPPTTLRLSDRELEFPRRRLSAQSLMVGAAAAGCTVLLIYVFLSALLGLKG